MALVLAGTRMELKSMSAYAMMRTMVQTVSTLALILARITLPCNVLAMEHVLTTLMASTSAVTVIMAMFPNTVVKILLYLMTCVEYTQIFVKMEATALLLNLMNTAVIVHLVSCSHLVCCVQC